MDMADSVPGGALRLADDLVLSRMGFGAMQLAGPGVFGPPRDRDQALAVLREAVDNGVTHIDTSDFYGPVTVNELIREALHPYPADLRIVTKVGARRGTDGSWRPSHDPADLKAQVRENLAHLGVAARLGASPQQVALAWLLQRSPTMVLIPGTSSLAHLRENIAAADLLLPSEAVAELDAIGR